MLTTHAIFAMMASWRLTELLMVDAGPWGIFQKVRTAYPTLFKCPRCMSVWAGLICTLFFLLAPWLNWPLAFSQTYLMSGLVAGLLQQKIRATPVEPPKVGLV